MNEELYKINQQEKAKSYEEGILDGKKIERFGSIEKSDNAFNV
jgi:hypothetical protein